MHVHVLGTGDAFSTKRFTTSFLVEADGFTLGIDCGDAHLRALDRIRFPDGTGIKPGDVDAYLITHLHGDHCNGLEATAFHSHFVTGRRLPLALESSLWQPLWEKRLAVAMGTLWDGSAYMTKTAEDYFDPILLDATVPNALGPFTVELFPGRHHIPVWGMRIVHKGVILGYSCDTAFNRGMLDFLEPASLVFHETGRGAAHTPLEALQDLPADFRDRLRIVHYGDNDVPPPGLTFACDGESCELPA